MRCSTPGMRRWTKGRKSPSHTWSNQPIAHPMHRIRNVRFNILVTTCRETLKLNLFNEIYVEIPMMNRKKGKTKSQGVSPFHTECCKGAYDTLPPALLTRIIPATVMPLSASSDKSLFLMGGACCAVSVLSSSFSSYYQLFINVIASFATSIQSPSADAA